MTKYIFTAFIFLSLQLFAQKNTTDLTATIIGSGSPRYNTERSGPSVLISYENTKIIVDMGNGTQANLDKGNIKINELDGIFFTHHHLDHNEEFVPIFIKALLGKNTFTIAGPKPTSDLVNSTLDVYNEDINYRLSRSKRTVADVKKNFTVKTLNGNESFTIGGIKITCVQVNHTIATVAYRFDAGGHSIVISGDLSYSENLPKLAQNADYLIIDSGGAIELGAKGQGNGSKRKTSGNTRNSNSDKKNEGKKDRAHVNLDESSRMAKEANVKNLVLTHFNFTKVDEKATTSQLRENYSGNVHYAEDLMRFSIEEDAHTHDGTTHSHNESLKRLFANECVVDLSIKSNVSITEDKAKDLRIIKSNSIPNHSVGKFPTQGNPNTISEQNKLYQIDLTPEIAKNKTYVYDLGIDKGKPNYVFGVAINGVKIEPSANEFFRNTETNQQNYEWTLEPLSDEVNLGEDCNNAHVQPNGEYHYHGTPTGLVSHFDEKKMNLVGWAADGFPMYHKVGYKDPMNPNSDVIELKSSYTLKKGERPGDGISAPNGAYSGKFVRDYEYQENHGDLDACNGRTGVTPEFPKGTYYYVVSDDFPSASRCFVGTPSNDFKVGGNRNTTPQQSTKQQPRGKQSGNGQPNFASMLQRLDANKDGKISKEEAKGNLKENFDKRDTNKDGYITESELERRN
ncbi:YHYH protein [Mariniflexile sp. AS56]|uniref:YHYH protein n=1 Tax=Mariniflexile sp. AS56 TaxID=3063957 RepID=UPI0026EB9893|nr:YHYH protein [Mariniflexile sp. AS56]MDO7171670.1 YHYH protein [Mariniflexile sp. AS56]